MKNLKLLPDCFSTREVDRKKPSVVIVEEERLFMIFLLNYRQGRFCSNLVPPVKKKYLGLIT